MANLIPPKAKHEMVTEYWIRVVTVWFILVGLSFIVVALLKIPTFILVESQLKVYDGAYDEAKDKTETFEQAQQTIVEANNLAELLIQEEQAESSLLDIMTVLDTIAGRDVVIDSFVFSRADEEMEAIAVSGVAATRIALANFSKEVEAHPLFVKAEVPISNLAKDKDIAFSISVEPAK